MSDLISRQVAIELIEFGVETLKIALDRIDVTYNDREKFSWGIGLLESYIEDIKELPHAQPEVAKDTNVPNNDCISRQQAIDAVAKWFYDVVDITESDGTATIFERLRELPSAQPDLDEWCPDCKEYDSKRHCCPRFNRVIRGALKDAQSHWTPCDWCKYNPPSSMDGKPCTICPAVGRGESDED